MKTYFFVNLCICLALLGGTVFVAHKVENATAQLEELEAGSQEDIRKLSNQLSIVLTRVGELESQLRTVGERVERLASKRPSTSENLEYQVKKIIAEERKSRRRGGQRGVDRAFGGMGDVKLKPEQREVATKLMQDGVKDWMELQGKVQAGEMTREEVRKILGEKWKRDMKKFRGTLDDEQRAKMGMGGDDPVETPVKAEETPERGDEKPVPEAENDNE